MCPDDGKQRTNNNTTPSRVSEPPSPMMMMMITDPLSISISKPLLRSSSSSSLRQLREEVDEDDNENYTNDNTTSESYLSSTNSTTTASSPTIVLLRLTFCAVGICTCYICYGIFHEKLLRITSSNNSQSQSNIMGPSFILFTQCITNVIVAMIWQQIQSSFRSQQQKSLSSSSNHSTTTSTPTPTNCHNLPHRMFVITSLCYVCAMICSNEAIPHVSYPVAVLGKSCKLIPTMIIGQVISYSSKYFGTITKNHSSSNNNHQQLFQQIAHTRNEWIAAICICIGIVTFHYQNPSFRNNHSNETDASTTSQQNQLLGIYLLCTSLFMDGLLSVCQNILKKSKPRPPNAVETMYYINLYAVVSIGLFCYGTGQFRWPNNNNNYSSNSISSYLQLVKDMNLATLYGMIQPYASILQHLCILNIAAACGQIFIFLTITWFTPVITTMITTTRKFITILLSVLLYGHSFTIIQWFCILFIFFGLYIAIIGTTTSTTAAATNDRNPLKKKKTQ